MANPFRGEAQIGTDGPVLVCDFNALCEIEAHFGTDIAASLDDIRRGDFGLNDLRAVVAALLRHAQPQISDKEAGTIIGQFFEDIRPAVDLAITRAMPEDDPGKKPSRRLGKGG